MKVSIRNIKSPRNSPAAVAKRTTPGIRHGRHCVFLMHVHLVFVGKYRKKLFTKEVLDFMETVFRDICTDFESELKEFNGEGDHVHLLIHYPPKVSVSKLVNSLNGVNYTDMFEQNNFRLFTNTFGWMPFGHLATLQVLAEELLWTSSNNTLISKTPRTNMRTPYIPGLNAGALRGVR